MCRTSKAEEAERQAQVCRRELKINAADLEIPLKYLDFSLHGPDSYGRASQLDTEHLYVGGTPVESKSTRSLTQARASDHVIIVGLFR